MENLGLLLKSLMGPRQTFQPGGGNLMEAMQQAQQPSADLGAGTPGELRQGADGKTYQYAQTSGMAGSTGDQGWIEANPAAFGKSGWRGGLSNLLDPRVGMPIAAGLISGTTPWESFGNAFALGGPALGKMKDERKANDYLSSNFPDLAQMVNAGMPIDAAWGAALKKKNADGSVTYGKTPQWGLDDQGNVVMGVNGDDGTFKKIETPGFHISKTPIKMDGGDRWILLDPVTRQPISEIPKNLEQAAANTARGKGIGENQAGAITALPGARTTAAMVNDQIEGLKNDPYLPNMLGPMDSRLPNMSGDAARVQGKMDQIQGGAFLQARQLLKGGGAITDYEGRMAEQAFVRMSAAQNDTDFKQALDDFNAAVQQGVAKLEAAAAGSIDAAPPPAGGTGTARTGVQWKVIKP